MEDFLNISNLRNSMIVVIYELNDYKFLNSTLDFCASKEDIN